MPEIEIGKWYYAKFGGTTYYIKPTKVIKSSKTIIGESIDIAKSVRHNNYSLNDSWHNEDLYDNALKNGPLTDLTEIQEILPRNHVDKFDTIIPDIKDLLSQFL